MESFLKSWLGIIYFVTFLVGAFVDGLPTGAPTSACTDLSPGHVDSQGVAIEPDTASQAPFVLFIGSQSTYDTRTAISVSIIRNLAAATDAYFRGFAIKAVTVVPGTGSSTKPAVGVFTTIPAGFRFGNCSHPNQLVTHSNIDLKSGRYDFTWIAEQDYGNIQFVSTLVVERETFYINVQTNTLTFNGDPCASTPCVNLGTCTANGDSYTCACTGDFVGTDCQLMNPCSTTNNPCFNGGLCSNTLLNGPPESVVSSCTCSFPFVGDNCQYHSNECRTTPPCVNGVCVEVINSFTCLCDPGWTGTPCDIAIQGCDANPCSVNGQCLNTAGGSFICVCNAGWTGNLCSDDINECVSTPCVNGICLNGINSFTCVCYPGYTGTLCAMDIDECRITPPCVNGLCVQEINSFKCVCDPGWTGTPCDIDINECISTPCYNNGYCLDGIHSFVCVCSLGWTGTLCDIDDPCLPTNPCQNSGTCYSGFDTSGSSFTCSCAFSWTGDTCTVPFGCIAVTCENGGSCTTNPLTGGFRECQCTPEYFGIFCENAFPCTINPCLNDGSCTNNGTISFTCNCVAPSMGQRCQAVNPCSSNPCLNNGVCSGSEVGDTTNTVYSCDCVGSWGGLRCETGACSPTNPCANGGICMSNTDGTFQGCQCQAGYTGSVCENDINECISTPCVNGVCLKGINSFACVCSLGWTGTLCDIASSTAEPETTNSIPYTSESPPNTMTDGATEPPSTPSNTFLYVGIAAGVIVTLFIVLAVYVIKLRLKLRDTPTHPPLPVRPQSEIHLNHAYMDAEVHPSDPYVDLQPDVQTSHPYTGLRPNHPYEEIAERPYAEITDRPYEKAIVQT